ncbi:MAG: VWA domain-containing protein [Anaerosomatales bacterium]|nr:VWA domain-containing protein [Anaerosomatales bacterium]
MSRRRFPFSAIVGQDALKVALLVNAVDARVGGVLIRGHKGTAKSTAVRALASVLPPIDVVDGCRYSCDPNDVASLCRECLDRAASGPLPRARRPVRVVDLPVSATEDRLVGTLDIEHALKHGERAFEPGLLAEANRGILYVDEVNLLDDHLVDALLDAAASGVNVVEREGVRHEHPARFILVGTMNPEEGELRPQLLDRFGLCVDVETIQDPAERVEVMRRRRAFEDDPAAFVREWASSDAALQSSIVEARRLLDDVALDDDLLFLIASICASLGVEGHRADLVMARAATAYALISGDREVRPSHIRAVAPMVLAHRMRKAPFEEEHNASERISRALAQAIGGDGADAAEGGSASGPPDADGQQQALGRVLPADAAAAPEENPRVQLDDDIDRIRRSVAGRTQRSTSHDGTGRYTRSEPVRPGARIDVAFDATIRAAAPHQADREGPLAITLEPSDLRNKVRTRRVGASIVFCVDASGSMGAANRMEAAKAAVLDLLVGAYQRRDRVGLVAFRGEGAEVLLAPTASVELAQLKLRSLPVGGATPLAHGLLRSIEVIESERKRNREIVPWLVLVTDGRANVGVDGGLGSEDARSAAQRVRDLAINTIVIDTTAVPGGGTAAREIARVAGADYVRLLSVDSNALVTVVKERVGMPA